MQKVEGSSPFSRSSKSLQSDGFSLAQQRVKVRLCGPFFFPRRFRDGNPALGEDIVRFGEVASEHPLEQRDGVIGVIEILLVDIRRRARVLWVLRVGNTGS
jgi:hypothetical protein